MTLGVSCEGPDVTCWVGRGQHGTGECVRHSRWPGASSFTEMHTTATTPTQCLTVTSRSERLSLQPFETWDRVRK